MGEHCGTTSSTHHSGTAKTVPSDRKHVSKKKKKKKKKKKTGSKVH